jgi:hypothetical protein
MDIRQAVNMRALANGMDLETGQTREADSIYLRPPTSMAESGFVRVGAASPKCTTGLLLRWWRVW